MNRDLSMSIATDSRWSLYWINAEPAWAMLLMIVAAGFGIMLMLGMRTRLASIASFIFLASLHNRNPYILQGGDNLLLLLTFGVVFYPGESGPRLMPPWFVSRERIIDTSARQL